MKRTTITYLILGILIIFSISLMYFMKYEVASLEDKVIIINEKQDDISSEISLLRVEWAYLNNPERIQELAGLYLKDNDYINIAQLKNIGDVNDYYVASVY